jgi:hypothetical protein
MCYNAVVTTALTVETPVVWTVIPCSLVELY